MNSTINFEELEVKTSAEFVTGIKKAITDVDGKELPIKLVRFNENILKEHNIDTITVLLIADITCYSFHYDRTIDYCITRKMLVCDAVELAEMYEEYKNDIIKSMRGA